MTLKEYYYHQLNLDNLVLKNKKVKLSNEEILKTRLLALAVEIGELAESLNQFKVNYSESLEEYVDCMHFMLSIANVLELRDLIQDKKLKDFFIKSSYKGACNKHLAISIFVGQYASFANFLSNWKYWKKEKETKKILIYQNWEELLSDFINLGHWIGFNISDIEIAYLEKLEKNYNRQMEGY